MPDLADLSVRQTSPDPGLIFLPDTKGARLGLSLGTIRSRPHSIFPSAAEGLGGGTRNQGTDKWLFHVRRYGK